MRVQNQPIMTQKAIKKKLDCKIEWNAVPQQEWSALFDTVTRTNLLQSVPYAYALAKVNHQRVRLGVINIDGQKSGLCLILEAGILKNMIHGVILDRGPIWFDGRGGAEDVRSFLEEFSRQFPKRFGRRIRYIPEINDTPLAHSLLQEYGFKREGEQPYKSYWLDLTADLDALRSNFKKRWRGQLKKSEQVDLEIKWSDEGEHFGWLMYEYGSDKALRGYDGVSVETMIALAREFSRGKNMLIGTALLDGLPIASILFLNHGRASTYQVGYSSDIGREKRAHYALLWSALSVLKERNIEALDLGGVNDNEAKGVKMFKEGMGGELYETVGLYS